MDDSFFRITYGTLNSTQSENETRKIRRLSTYLKKLAHPWILGALAIILINLYLEYRKGSTVIELISVPPSIAESGITKEVFTQTIANEILRIQTIVREEIVTEEDKQPIHPDNELVEFEIPGTNIVWSTIRELFSVIGFFERETISGAMFCDSPSCIDGNVQLNLTINNRKRTTTSGKANIEIVVPTKEVLKLDSVIKSTAIKILSEVRPLDATAYFSMTGNNAAAESILVKMLIPIEDDHVGALRQLFLINANKGNFEQAIEYADRAEKLSVGAQRSRVLSDSGWLQVQLGNHSAAIDKFKTAIRIDSENSEAYTNLGVSLRRLGDTVEATRMYKKSFEIDMLDSQNLSNWGFALRHEGLLAEASKCYEMATQVNPKNERALNNWAYTFRLDNKNDLALEKYKQALIVNPKYETALFNMGLVLRDLGRHTDAIEAYQTAISFRPDYERAYVSLALTYRELDQLEKASEIIEQAREIAPEYSRAFYNSALISADLGNLDEAKEFITKALALAPESDDIASLHAYLFAQEQLSQSNSLPITTEPEVASPEGFKSRTRKDIPLCSWPDAVR